MPDNPYLQWPVFRRSVVAAFQRSLTVKGAEQRLVELAEEARAIFAAFPELRGRGRGFEVSRGRKAEPAASLSKRSRKAMSPAARRKIALAQKKRWADWRKKKATAA